MSERTASEQIALDWLNKIRRGDAVKLTSNDALIIMEMLERNSWPATHTTFALGDAVEKIRGSSWHGHVVGWYSTKLTPEGYAVESFHERGSVQIYPAAALRRIPVGLPLTGQPPLTQDEIDGIGV